MNQSQSLLSTGSGANSLMSLLSCARKASVVRESKEKPITANWGGRSRPLAKLHSAGISLRFVRSPLAPKITITQGLACCPCSCKVSVIFIRSVFDLPSGRFTWRSPPSPGARQIETAWRTGACLRNRLPRERQNAETVMLSGRVPVLSIRWLQGWSSAPRRNPRLARRIFRGTAVPTKKWRLNRAANWPRHCLSATLRSHRREESRTDSSPDCAAAWSLHRLRELHFQH